MVNLPSIKNWWISSLVVVWVDGVIDNIFVAVYKDGDRQGNQLK